MIFRDDDIGGATCFDLFRSVDSLFREHNVRHTVAVIAEDIEKNTPLVDYIRAHPHINVQLHCWAHGHDRETEAMTKVDPEALAADLLRGANKLHEVFGVRATVLYPPWNESNQAVVSAASQAGLKVSHKKISLEAYIRGNREQAVINFHYWSARETSLLEKALQIHAKSR